MNKRRRHSAAHIEKVGKQAVELAMSIRVGATAVTEAIIGEIDDPVNVMVALACMINVVADDDEMSEFGAATFRVMPE